MPARECSSIWPYMACTQGREVHAGPGDRGFKVPHGPLRCHAGDAEYCACRYRKDGAAPAALERIERVERVVRWG